MIQRLSTRFMAPDDLRKLMGDEAYYKGLKLAEEDKKQDRLDQIKADYFEYFAEEIDAKWSDTQWKITMAHQEIGQMKRDLKQKNADLEQKKADFEQKIKEITVKAEKEKAVLLKIAEANAKKERELLLKLADEKAKKEKKELLKIEKEKQKQLLKEKEKQEQLLKKKEKQEQLLKAEKEKQLLQTRIKLVHKLLEKKTDVEEIAELLEVSVKQVQIWVQNIQK